MEATSSAEEQALEVYALCFGGAGGQGPAQPGERGPELTVRTPRPPGCPRGSEELSQQGRVESRLQVRVRSTGAVADPSWTNVPGGSPVVTVVPRMGWGRNGRGDQTTSQGLAGDKSGASWFQTKELACCSC